MIFGKDSIRLSSAVTILSTLDPVRVFQDFATVDLLSGGRAELIAGRSAYIESFSLFGDDFANYDALFAEKLDLLLKLSDSDRVTWNGRFRPSLSNSQISPRPASKLPIWLGVGGNPESALRSRRARLQKPELFFRARTLRAMFTILHGLGCSSRLPSGYYSSVNL